MNLKTKIFIKIVISGLILIISAKMIYNRFILYLYKDTYIINAVDEIKKDDGIKNLNEKTNIQLETSQTKQEILSEVENTTQKNENKNQTQKNYNVTLKYTNKRAKKVKITGSFSSWKELDMKKKENDWIINLTLKDPGIYKYYFIVDGKKILDPKANKSKDGNYSLLEIK